MRHRRKFQSGIRSGSFSLFHLQDIPYSLLYHSVSSSTRILEVLSALDIPLTFVSCPDFRKSGKIASATEKSSKTLVIFFSGRPSQVDGVSSHTISPRSIANLFLNITVQFRFWSPFLFTAACSRPRSFPPTSTSTESESLCRRRWQFTCTQGHVPRPIS